MVVPPLLLARQELMELERQSELESAKELMEQLRLHRSWPARI